MLSGNKKYANEILDDVECYKAVLDGRLNQFPKGFWTKPWSQQSAAVITRYLLEERLKFREEDIKTKVNVKLFADNKLRSLTTLFESATHGVIDNAYPNKFKPWELSGVPRGFWGDRNNIREAIRWVVETKLDNNRERVCKEFNQKLLIDNGLGKITLLGVYNILNIGYPHEFKQWELGVVTPGFWRDKNNVIEAVKWLVENKLDNNRERVCKEFNASLVNNYNVYGLAKLGLYDTINLAYPNEFKPWELSSVTNGFWDNKNNIIEAVRWAVETKLNNNRERVCKEFNNEFISKNGLISLNKYGIFKLLDMAYPHKFKPWELSSVPQGFWDKEENIIEAVKWIVETKLDNNIDRVLKEFNTDLIKKYNIASLAQFGLYNIINLAYPNQFKPSDFKYIKNR